MMAKKALETLREAAKFVGNERQKGTAAELIILAMVSQFGATRSVSSSGGAYTLRCGGVRGSCTWSRDEGLLKSWNGNATVKLFAANLEGTGQ